MPPTETITVPVNVPVQVTSQSVPVGPTTIAGAGVSIVSFVLALVAVASSHGTHQDVEVVVAGAIGLTTTAITLIGRYLQAHAALRMAASVAERLKVPR